MTVRFTINGPVKGGKNNMLINRYGQHYPKPKWAAWRNQFVASLISATSPEFITLTTPLVIEVKYWSPDLKRRDVPAMVDSIYHCLERAGIVEDDFLLHELHWLPMGLDRENPRVEIRITNESQG